VLSPSGPAGAAPDRVSVAVEDFIYFDTSGEPVDQTAAHERRLQAFMAALRSDVEADQRYQLRASAGADTRFRIVGGIHKMSTLVLSAKVVVIDADAKKAVSDKLYSFRGDNDEAWRRAELFVSRDVMAALAQPGPVGLAVFDFELEDMTAAPAAGLAEADIGRLREVSDGVREALRQSGRYRMVDVSSATADAVKGHTLRDCGGCDAPIAAQLGADQSLIGVVRRVSRTEYTLGFQVRDARTSAVLTRADSGLRMGADYSWTRGAVRLVADRLIEEQPPR
jgi:hypothetical protein